MSEAQLSYRKILLIKTGAAGDLVLTSPFFRSMGASFPESEIHLLTKREYCEIVEPCPVFHRFHWLESGYQGNWRVLNKEHFDLAVNLQVSTRTRILMMGLRAKVKAGFSDSLWSRFIYQISVPSRLPGDIRQSQVVLLRRLGAEKILTDFQLWLDENSRRCFPEFLSRNGLDIDRPWVVIHPGSSPEWTSKRWPPERFAAVADGLSRAGCLVIFVGSGEQKELAVHILSLMSERAIDLSGKTSFSQLVQVIETARLLITTDSAPLHIGAASGTRTLALFGPTDPRRHCPPNVWFLSRSLACSPCYRKFCASLECLKSISAEEVLVQARRLLSEG